MYSPRDFVVVYTMWFVKKQILFCNIFYKPYTPVRPIVNLRGGGWGLALALLGWTCREPLRRGLAGRCCRAGWVHVMLRRTPALLRPGTQSRPQVVQLVPFT